MGGGIARPRRRLKEFGTCRNAFVERHHAVGQIPAEAADVADRKQLGRNLHRDLGLRMRADAR